MFEQVGEYTWRTLAPSCVLGPFTPVLNAVHSHVSASCKHGLASLCQLVKMRRHHRRWICPSFIFSFSSDCWGKTKSCIVKRESVSGLCTIAVNKMRNEYHLELAIQIRRRQMFGGFFLTSSQTKQQCEARVYPLIGLKIYLSHHKEFTAREMKLLLQVAFLCVR